MSTRLRKNWRYSRRFRGSAVGEFLDKQYGLTFLKDYRSNNGTLDADFNLGSPTATFTASRDATHPATYIDSDGIIQATTTSDVPRWTSGFYATNGIYTAGPGLLIEGARTNLIKNGIFGADTAGLADNWTLSDDVTNAVTKTVVEETVTNISNSHAQRLQQTFGDGTTTSIISDKTAAGTFTVDETATASVWLKGTLTGISSLKLTIKQYDNADAAGTVLSDSDIKATVSASIWKRFEFSTVTADADADKVEFQIVVLHPGSGSIDLYIVGAQVEQAPYASSFIPTTAAALTRNEEILEHVILNNRTAATESMVISLSPGFKSGTAGSKYFVDTDTKRRRWFFSSANEVLIYGNASDSATSLISNLVDENYSANQLITLGASFKITSTPYIAGYFDGVADGTDESTDNFTTPAWGTNFQIGAANDTSNNFFGIIHSIAFFNKALSVAEHQNVYDILN